MTMKSREGQPNPDAAIVEAALEKSNLRPIEKRMVLDALHFEGKSAHQIVADWKEIRPAFVKLLREGVAARRGQRFGGHGIQPPQGGEK